MRDFAKTLKMMLKGNRPIYFLSYLFQFFMVFCMVFTSFLTSVLVDAFGGVAALEKASSLEKAVASLIANGQGFEYLVNNKMTIGYWVMGAAFVTAFISFVRMWLRAKASSAINKTTQNALFDHLEALPYPYFKAAKSGDLIQTCTRDVDVCRQFLIRNTSEVLYALWMTVFCVVVLFQTSWSLALVSLFLLPFLFVYAFYFIKKVRRAYRAADDAEAGIIDRLNDNLSGVRVIKAFNAEKREIGEFEKNLGAYEKVSRYDRFLESFFYSSSDILIFLSRSLSLVYAIYLCFKGEISAGSVAISYTFVNMMVWPMRGAAQTISAMGQTLASSDRIQALLNAPHEDLDDGYDGPIEGDIEFKDVGFAYPDDPDMEVLHNVSFHLSKGKTYAIMGKTGSGKSTIYALLSRLYEPTSGEIYLDGRPLKSFSKRNLRKNIASVLQDPFLFSRSVADNIAISHPKSENALIRQVAKIADVDEAINEFDKGYDTPVGEKGVTLSGGQKQRVAIARALLVNAPILFLDDSLSAVDAETDLTIRSRLAEDKRGSSKIIVTHRISTAKDSDYIYFFSEGRLVEEGTHEELLSKRGLYYEINSIQSILPENEREGGE